MLFRSYRKSLVENYRSNRTGLAVMLVTGLAASFNIVAGDDALSAFGTQAALIISVAVCLATFIINLFKKFRYASYWLERDEQLLWGLKALKMNSEVMGFGE